MLDADHVAHNPPRFSHFIERLRSRLGLSYRELSHLLTASVARARALCEGRVEPMTSEFVSLSRSLDIDFEALLQLRVDVETLVKQHYGQTTAVPSRYTHHPKSRVYSAQVYLDNFQQRFGWWHRQDLLRALQVTEASLQDGESPISIRLFEDMSELLSIRYGYLAEDFEALGRSSILARIGDRVTANRKPRDLVDFYERFCESQIVDGNCDHRILQASSTLIIIESQDRRDFLENNNGVSSGNTWVSHYVAGAFASFPTYLGLPEGRPTLLKERHQSGDKTTWTMIEFRPQSSH